MSSIDGKDAATRKAVPVYSGVMKYFPDALIEIARLSKIGNDQHNPGQPLHWSRGKSNDHADCLVRHQIDAGKVDTDGVRHSAKVAWRALAQLQLEIEAADSVEARGADLMQSLQEAPTPLCEVVPVYRGETRFAIGTRVKDITDGILGTIESFHAGADSEPGARVRWENVGLAIWYPLSQLEAVS